MKVEIWDNHNKQWLEPISLLFNKDGELWKVQACLPGTDILSDGWYDIEGENLKKISIRGNVSFNKGLIPNK